MKKPAHDLQVFLLSLGAGFPALLATVILLWGSDIDPKVRWTVSVVVGLVWLFASMALRERVLRPLQTAAN
ncbi:MAG: PAS domain-containing sensor histidine kinase, partial [Myxococcales bacterium]